MLLRDWRITQANLVEGQPRERLAFDAATRLDAHAALLATSWGLPQMMGFNAQACGYPTVEAMVEAFRVSEANHVTAMLRFIKSKPAMAGALKKKEWGVLAYYYNGPAYKQFNYDKRLATAYAQLT
ncbi:N-acetylmuramidase domain-containing protein [Hymenobacter bucti]|uniref:N-acetylmuramidase domain-containing protein n=1 Tax=Hymenobacter bucti TaxID=1844114 RepID=A0ABW4QY72_9BACT